MHLKKARESRYIRRRRLLAAALAVSLGLTCYETAAASTIDKAEKKKSQAQQELNAVNDEIENIQAAQSSLQAEMQSYDTQLMNLLTDMEILAGDMETQQEEIAQADADLATAKQEEREQYEAMKARIQYMYENGGDSILTMLIGSGDMTEFLNRVEYVSDVYEYDRQMLTDYQNVVQEVEDLTVRLDNEMAEMEELQLSYGEQQASLQQVIASKRAQMSEFDSQLADAQALASQYAQTIRQQNQIIAAEKARKEKEAAEKKQEEAQKKKQQAAGTAASSESASGSSEKTESASSAKGTEDSSTGGSSANGLTDSGLDPGYSTNVSGSDVVAYASKFLGNPYVLGGNSLTEGTDCSYFVMAVYAHFGISLPRSSYQQASCGKAVSYANAKAGDIICYPGHVAIYIGNGQIIHASNPKTGVCYGTATYRTITSVRRVL